MKPVCRMTPKTKRTYKALLLNGRPWVECHYCGQRITSETLTFDHIIPRSLGGGNFISNLLLACQPCNGKRGNKPYAEFVAQVAA